MSNPANNGDLIVVAQTTPVITEVTPPAQPQIVEVLTQGPQGPSTLAGLSDVNVNNRVRHSVLYYDHEQGMWLGDGLNTIEEVVNGGNF